MKKEFLTRIFLLFAGASPLLMGAQEPMSEPVSQPTSAPVSAPVSAPTITPMSIPASIPVSLEVVAPEVSVSRQREPTFIYMYGVYKREKKRSRVRNLFKDQERDTAAYEEPRRFTIGLTESGEAWKLWSSGGVEGPFASIDALLQREKLNPKRLYAIDTYGASPWVLSNNR